MSKFLLASISGALMLCAQLTTAQLCTPPADNTATFGTNNQWLAYFYRDANFTDYHGRVMYGLPNNPNVDLKFVVPTAAYNPTYDVSSKGNTFKCGLPMDTFSVRMQLTKNFTAGIYEFVVGSGERVRLYIDGTLITDRYFNNEYDEYAATLPLTAGNHNIVIEYVHTGGIERVKFKVGAGCLGTPTAEPYGTNNRWVGYLYDGCDFDYYKGSITYAGGLSGLMNMAFGNDAVNLGTNQCPMYTESFSARFKLQKHFEPGTYLFSIGSDDGSRLSVDGGATWLIDEWYDHGFFTSARAIRFTTAGVRNIVLEYYDRGQGNTLFFDQGVTLPVVLTSFEGRLQNNMAMLSWQTTASSTEDHFIIERSSDGRTFTPAGKLYKASATTIAGGNKQYNFTDRNNITGTLFYRLKINDADGKPTYSNIIIIQTQQQSRTKIYPTIIEQNKQLFIQAGNNITGAEVVIRNIAGQLIHTEKIGKLSANQVTTLKLHDQLLSKGQYVIQLFAENQMIHKAMIIVN